MLGNSVAQAESGTIQGRCHRGAQHRSIGSGRKNARLSSPKAAQAQAVTNPMSKVMQGIKNFLGIKSKASSFDMFHETADRIAKKTEMVQLQERNGFAHSVARIKQRKKKERS